MSAPTKPCPPSPESSRRGASLLLSTTPRDAALAFLLEQAERVGARVSVADRVTWKGDR